MELLERHNVKVSGAGDGRPMVFAHGLGCDQIMWRYVAPRFARRFRVVAFDHVGHGGADRDAYDPQRHAELTGYAEDLLAILEELDLREVVYVGHSVSAMIGFLAATGASGRFSALVSVAGSPRYVDDEDYRGGFTAEQVAGVLEAIDRNWEDWSRSAMPGIVGEEYREDLAAQLTYSFCRTDPEIIKTFARATFTSDLREVLGSVEPPCLVIQCARDAMAPPSVGEYMAARLPDARLVVLDAGGHVPHVTVPAQTADAIAAFVRSI